jgi:hypothetical protein
VGDKRLGLERVDKRKSKLNISINLFLFIKLFSVLFDRHHDVPTRNGRQLQAVGRWGTGGYSSLHSLRRTGKLLASIVFDYTNASVGEILSTAYQAIIISTRKAQKLSTCFVQASQWARGLLISPQPVQLLTDLNLSTMEQLSQQ